MGLKYEVISHEANEQEYGYDLPLETVVLRIAQLKMKHAILPAYRSGQEIIFVLTADTLGTDYQGVIHGKPKNRIDACKKINAARGGKGRCATAFCIEKKKYSDQKWQTVAERSSVVTAEYKFEVPDEWVDRYLDNTAALHASGAIAIEGYGLQFLKMINGSFTTIIGLPLFEVRQALEELGFFSK